MSFPKFTKQIALLISSLEELITEAKALQQDLEQEQDLSQEELENFDPEEEGAIEPEEIDNSEEIERLCTIIEQLIIAKDALQEIGE
jgi:hypothetical protein